MKEFLPKSAAKMADCLMKRYGLLTSRWSYDYGVAWRGMEALYAMTGEKKYFDYIKDAMDTFVTDESGAIRDYIPATGYPSPWKWSVYLRRAVLPKAVLPQAALWKVPAVLRITPHNRNG